MGVRGASAQAEPRDNNIPSHVACGTHSPCSDQCHAPQKRSSSLVRLRQAARGWKAWGPPLPRAGLPRRLSSSSRVSPASWAGTCTKGQPKQEGVQVCTFGCEAHRLPGTQSTAPAKHLGGPSQLLLSLPPRQRPCTQALPRRTFLSPTSRSSRQTSPGTLASRRSSGGKPVSTRGDWRWIHSPFRWYLQCHHSTIAVP